jgi:hypothetical protein
MHHHKARTTYYSKVSLGDNCQKLNSQGDLRIKVGFNLGLCMQDSGLGRLDHKISNFYNQYKL